MLEYIKHHALKNVWCTPEQDYQLTFNPVRITTPNGVRKYTEVEWDRIWLPDDTSKFHVYQLGNLSPKTLKLNMPNNLWVSLTELCNDNNVIIDVCFANGRQLPRFASYLRRTPTGNLILAIKEQPRIGNLKTDSVYIRFYANAFFSSVRSHPTEDYIFTKGQYATTRASVVSFQRDIRDFQLEGGHVYVFHNGMIVNDTHPDLVVEGDVIELVHDTTIKQVIEYKIDDLETFLSTLDELNKYLIVRDPSETNAIDFHDDIDFWLVKRTSAAFKGVFYYKSNPESVRMVTHKDYSIPVSRILALANANVWVEPLKLSLRLHIRKSGYSRELVNEHHRIRELCRLDKERTHDAMIGVNSTVDVWKAASLEASNYPKIMRSLSVDVTPELVQEAYGYNAISKLVADTPKRVEVIAGAKGIELPFGLRTNSTMFEYDSEGKLLEYHHHASGDIYYTNNLQTTTVEGIMGIGSQNLPTYFDQKNVAISDIKNVACYITPISGGVPTYVWQRILPTADNGFYTFSNNEINWNEDLLTNNLVAVREDSNFLLYSKVLNLNVGVLTFDLEANEFYNGNSELQALKLPLLHLDLFLNGYALIEGLDYFVRNFKIVITNKEYLNTATPDQVVVIRAIGLAGETVYWEKKREFGFVEHNLLSRNNKYDIRDDKLIRYVVGGKLRHKEDLKFSEDGIEVRMDNIPNGTPYSLMEPPVPLRGLLNTNVYDFREKAYSVDETIKNYLSVFYPEEEIAEPSVITERYQLLSPFVSKIHYDLSSGYFYPEGIKEHYNDMDIAEWIKPYTYLLDFDPVKNSVDLRYVSVHPHHLFVETELDIYQYKFLQRIVKLYFGEDINLSGHVRIKDSLI